MLTEYEDRQAPGKANGRPPPTRAGGSRDWAGQRQAQNDVIGEDTAAARPPADSLTAAQRREIDMLRDQVVALDLEVIEVACRPRSGGATAFHITH